MFLNQSGAQGGEEGRSGSISFVHPTSSPEWSALCVHTPMGVSARRRCENLLMFAWKNQPNPALRRQDNTCRCFQRLKVNMNTFRIYCCSLFGSTAGVKSAHLWCFLFFFTHSTFVAIDLRRFWLLVKFRGDEESQSPWCALYLPGNVTAYRNTPRVHLFTVHSCVHSRHTFIEPASMTRCWSDDLQAGWENKPNGRMWTGRSASDAAASNHICVSHRTTSKDCPLS